MCTYNRMNILAVVFESRDLRYQGGCCVGDVVSIVHGGVSTVQVSTDASCTAAVASVQYDYVE